MCLAGRWKADKRKIMMKKATIIAILMIMGCLDSFAQTTIDTDSIFTISSDSVLLQDLDLMLTDSVVVVDTLQLSATDLQPSIPTKQKKDWDTWMPDPQRALWLALVIPGGGQIYNRKYWKLPIVYGGFLGCIYALTWNNMMYKDYSQAYLDIMDDDPTTASYEKFLHLGRQIDDSNRERYKSIFKSRKDKYRRWRDMSLFVMVGIYALAVIDAYVDAELSVFDISKDLSLKVQPTVISNPVVVNPLYASSVGINCKLNF